MKKNISYIFLLLLFATGFIASAQGNKLHTQKAAKQANLEKDIQAFINENIDKYELSAEKAQQVIEKFSKLEPSKRALLSKTLDEVKRNELRELYFSENPDAMSSISMRLPVDPVYICDNGGFEDGVDEYDFLYDAPTATAFNCQFNTGTLTPQTVSSTVNNFSANVTLVDVGFDPVLNALPTPIQIERVRTGSSAIKLNNNGPSYGVTSMSKVFTVNSSKVSYSFSLIVENPLNHADDDQPHFIVRLYDMNDNILGQNCIIADVNNTLLFNNADNHPTEPLLYTGWQCGSLSTEGVPDGDQLRLEFIITDCGLGAHYGTVYIDDICSSDDCETAYGEAELYDNTQVNCPAFPINVCGSYLVPRSINTDPVIYGTLTSLELNVLDSSNTVVATLTTPVITGNDFCFELNDTDFTTALSGDYEFEAVATFSIGGQAVVSQDLSANAGPDMSFNNCSNDCDLCVTIITDVAALVTDNQQAKECIKAYNTVNDDAIAVYRAGKEVLLTHDTLNGDFESLKGSIGHFYISGCSDAEYQQRPIAGNKPLPVKSIDLIEKSAVSNSFIIYPNPVNDRLNITAHQHIRSAKLTTLEGKRIDVRMEHTEKDAVRLDMQAVSSGIYILTVETADGAVTTHKIVRE